MPADRGNAKHPLVSSTHSLLHPAGLVTGVKGTPFKETSCFIAESQISDTTKHHLILLSIGFGYVLCEGFLRRANPQGGAIKWGKTEGLVAQNKGHSN